MHFKLLLLALALFGAAKAEYDYNNNNNVKLSTSSNEINALEQNTANSGEDYRSNYQAGQTNAQNSQATPTGYDYEGVQLTEAGEKRAPLFPVPLPVLREQTRQVSEVFPPASYSYNYAVNDASTGDIKDHQETRDGYVVRGSYSLIDPDGYKRTVTYTADNVHGFNAVVNRVPFALKKLAVVAPNVVLDERAPVSHVSALAEGSALVKDNTLKAIPGDSYVNAAQGRDATGGIYA